MALLEVQGLQKSFGSIIAAESLDIAVGEREALGIIGPNGAGKTTLFNLIAGGLRPDSGRIVFNGNDISQTPPHLRCRAGIGRSYQIPLPFESLTVFENLLTGAIYGRGKSEAEAAQSCAIILEQTHLIHRANTLAGALTLLERKRLELARALATEPRLLLLDEIAGGLTEGECDELVTTIKAIHADGITIIWIEHVVHALLAVVTRLVALNFGRKIADGVPRTVMASKEVSEIYMGIEA